MQFHVFEYNYSTLNLHFYTILVKHDLSNKQERQQRIRDVSEIGGKYYSEPLITSFNSLRMFSTLT